MKSGATNSESGKNIPSGQTFETTNSILTGYEPVTTIMETQEQGVQS